MRDYRSDLQSSYQGEMDYLATYDREQASERYWDRMIGLSEEFEH